LLSPDVFAKVWLYKDQLRAQALPNIARHRRADAKLPRLICSATSWELYNLTLESRHASPARTACHSSRAATSHALLALSSLQMTLDRSLGHLLRGTEQRSQSWPSTELFHEYTTHLEASACSVQIRLIAHKHGIKDSKGFKRRFRSGQVRNTYSWQ